MFQTNGVSKMKKYQLCLIIIMTTITTSFAMKRKACGRLPHSKSLNSMSEGLKNLDSIPEGSRSLDSMRRSLDSIPKRLDSISESLDSISEKLDKTKFEAKASSSSSNPPTAHSPAGGFCIPYESPITITNSISPYVNQLLAEATIQDTTTANAKTPATEATETAVDTTTSTATTKEDYDNDDSEATPNEEIIIEQLHDADKISTVINNIKTTTVSRTSFKLIIIAMHSWLASNKAIDKKESNVPILELITTLVLYAPQDLVLQKLSLNGKIERALFNKLIDLLEQAHSRFTDFKPITNIVTEWMCKQSLDPRANENIHTE